MMRSIRAATALAWALLALLATAPALAADPVFPPTSRLGLVPPPGMVVSKEFPGFEDRDRKTAILLTELPAEAYAEIEKGAAAEILKASGATVESHGPFTLPSGAAFLVVGRQQAEGLTVRKWVLIAQMQGVTAAVTVQVPDNAKDTYSDDTVRAALGTLQARTAVPAEEQLSALPFTLRDLAGFRLVRVAPGSAALLTEGTKDAVDFTEQPLILVTVATGAPAEPADRERFARVMFGSTPAIKDVRMTRAEPQRIGGQPGHEIVADAKDMKGDTPLTVVQWLRFGTGGYLRILAVARKDAWGGMYPRFRTVRDGIEPK